MQKNNCLILLKPKIWKMVSPFENKQQWETDPMPIVILVVLVVVEFI